MAETPLLSGKTVLITGATQGIGLATAVGLARHQPEALVLVGRDPGRTQAAVEKVKAEGGTDRVTSLLADLSSQKSIHALAAAFKAQHGKLHVLVNNAGGIFSRREVTEDGYERTFALNHLAPFLLTQLLREVLVASAPARVITTSSGAHWGARLDLGDLMAERGYGAWRAYCNSKLANILFTHALAKRLEGTKVTAYSLHPGFVASGFGHNDRGLISLGMTLLRPFAKTPEQGSLTSIWLATSPELATASGGYYAHRRPAKPSAAARDDAAAEKLWALSEALVGQKLPRANVA